MRREIKRVYVVFETVVLEFPCCVAVMVVKYENSVLVLLRHL
jgi:hypothetical protein